MFSVLATGNFTLINLDQDQLAADQLCLYTDFSMSLCMDASMTGSMMVCLYGCITQLTLKWFILVPCLGLSLQIATCS